MGEIHNFHNNIASIVSIFILIWFLKCNAKDGHSQNKEEHESQLSCLSQSSSYQNCLFIYYHKNPLHFYVFRPHHLPELHFYVSGCIISLNCISMFFIKCVGNDGKIVKVKKPSFIKTMRSFRRHMHPRYKVTLEVIFIWTVYSRSICIPGSYH